MIENFEDFFPDDENEIKEMLRERGIDLDELEKAVKKRKLPSTQGFFFGNDADQHYYDRDLEFIKNARAELFLGLKVFYNSSW